MTEILKQTNIDNLTWDDVSTCIKSFEKNIGLDDIEYHKTQGFWDIAHAIEKIYDSHQWPKPNVSQRPDIYRFMYLNAVFYEEGYSVSQDQDRAQKLCEFISNEANFFDKYTNFYVSFAVFALAIRSLIDEQDKKSIPKIRSYLNNPLNLLSSREHKYFLRTLSDVYNNRSKPEYIKAIEILQPYLQGKHHTQGIVDLLENSNISETTKVEIRKIVTLKSWNPIAPVASNDMYFVEMFSRLQTHGIDANMVFNNTISYGPFYNPLSINALPIVGEFSPLFRGGNQDGKPIRGGKGLFTGLTANDKGDINFSFTQTPHALIFDEDIDVLLVLAFSEKTMLLPSIDVPNGKNFDTIVLRKKITSPSWLLTTELGRTLYATDVLAGELAWSINNFTVSNNDAENKAVQLFQAIKTKLSECKGIDIQSTPAAINVNPKQIHLYGKVTVSDHMTYTSIAPISITMGVDGFFKSAWGRTKHHNSTEYSHTQKTKILTEHFNDIALIFPVYERLRQIVRITYSLLALKRTNFSPSDRLMEYIATKENEFKSRQTTEQPEYANYLSNFDQLKR